MQNLKFIKATSTAHEPTRGSEHAAGLDLYADHKDSICIWPGDKYMISTGIKLEIPDGYVGLLFIRSSWANKYGLRLATGVSVIDSDYRGVILAEVVNDSQERRWINPGDRFCQIVIMPFLAMAPTEVTELSETLRGEGGFGSSGQEGNR